MSGIPIAAPGSGLLLLTSSRVTVAVPCLGLLILLCQDALCVQLLLDLLLEVLSMLLHIVLASVWHWRRSEPQIAPAALLRATSVNLAGRMGWQECRLFSIVPRIGNCFLVMRD